MSANDSDSTLISAVAALGALAVLASGLGAAASLATSNALLLGSDWQLPALLSAAVVVLTFAAIVVAGGPSRRWRRTPYW